MLLTIGPPYNDNSWQAKADEGFDVANFRIDWEKKTVTCPQERQSIRWSKTKTARGRKMIQVGFAPHECAGCTSRPLCTRAKNLPTPSPCSQEKSTRPSSSPESVREQRILPPSTLTERV